MNSTEMEKALRTDSFVDQYLMGIFSADELPTMVFPGAYIVNTDESSQKGMHWLAFFTTNGTVECFDSFGKNPGLYSLHIKKWIEDTYKVLHCEELQSRDTTVCGQYCMYFLLLRSYGFSYEDVMSSLTRKAEINDQFVCRFINKFFKFRKQVRDKYFLIQQAINGQF